MVIGPGLGRSESAFDSFRKALINAKSNNLPIVIDADGLFILTYDLSLIKGYTKCILTPNYMEFKRLYEYSV
jgi:ATP-dependent NAD(P)H-hydrate dehydratase